MNTSAVASLELGTSTQPSNSLVPYKVRVEHEGDGHFEQDYYFSEIYGPKLGAANNPIEFRKLENDLKEVLASLDTEKKSLLELKQKSGNS